MMDGIKWVYVLEKEKKKEENENVPNNFIFSRDRFSRLYIIHYKDSSDWLK
jgi:hypothetical protein